MKAAILFEEKTLNAKVFIHACEVFYALGKLGILSKKITLFRSTDQVEVLESSSTLIPPRLKIKISKYDDIRLCIKGGSNPYYSCSIGADQYEVIPHIGRKHSIFKNQKQIAFFDKTEWANWGADKYIIVADDNCAIELLIGFLLCLHIIDGSNKSSIVSGDIGNHWENKAFDTSWVPIENNVTE